eukprot:2788819-Amphidinium_carterae.1
MTQGEGCCVLQLGLHLVSALVLQGARSVSGHRAIRAASPRHLQGSYTQTSGGVVLWLDACVRNVSPVSSSGGDEGQLGGSGHQQEATLFPLYLLTL